MDASLEAVVSETQGSLITIFAIWNTMMGTSLLTMPWAIAQAGLGAALICMVFMATLCLYTSYRVVDSPRFLDKISPEAEIARTQSHGRVEFVEVCERLLGPAGRWSAILFSAIALVGATVVFWELMSKFLHALALCVYDLVSGREFAIVTDLVCDEHHSDKSAAQLLSVSRDDQLTQKKSWILHLINNKFTWPCALIFALFPLISIKDPSFAHKFTALGTVSVVYLLCFNLYNAISWGINIDFYDRASIHFDKPFKATFTSLTGVLCLSFFIQNCILTLLKHQRTPVNNSRDLCIAFGLVAGTYVLIGVPFFISFPLAKSCIADNFLENFAPSDQLASVTRAFLLLQYLTLYPLIAYIAREQILTCLFKSGQTDSFRNLVFNAALVGLCVSMTIFVPQVGVILRYCGALSGLAYVFALPSMVYIVGSRNNGTLGFAGLITHTFIIILGVVNMLAQFLESYFES